MDTKLNLVVENPRLKDLLEVKALIDTDFDLAYSTFLNLKNHKQSWHTKWWRDIRKLLIAHECKVCGATEGTMVLQHFRHPSPFGSILYQIWREALLSGGVMDNQGERSLDSREFKELYDSFVSQECVRRKALEINLDQEIDYVSLANTSTFCKRCAYLWDMKGIFKCQQCTRYHSIFLFPNCIED